MRRSFAVVLCAVVVMCCCVPVAAASRTQALRHLETIDTLDRRLVSLDRQLQSLEAARVEAEHAQARAISQQAVSTLALRRAQSVLGRRLGKICRRTPAQGFLWRAGAKRLSAWLDEERLVRAVAAHDHRLMVEVRAQQALLARASEAKAQALTLLKRSQGERRHLLLSLGRERRRRVDALERLARLDGRRGAVHVMLHKAREQLNAVVSRDVGDVNGRSVAREGQWPREGTVAPGDMTPSARNALPWPVAGALRTRYGDRVDLAFGTVTKQNGIDIAAPVGARVRAVARGQVVYADWLAGFGQTVIVAHPHDVHSVHAHLSHVSVSSGQGVEAQQSLGFVGDTGSMRGRVLYFELRKQGRPEDPLRWLSSPG